MLTLDFLSSKTINNSDLSSIIKLNYKSIKYICKKTLIVKDVRSNLRIKQKKIGVMIKKRYP